MNRILVIWGNWGPYHYARFEAFREAGKRAGYEVEGLELFPSSGHYEWEIDQKGDAVHHINIGPVESRFHPWRLTRLALPKIRSLQPDVLFLPSYWHWSLFINFFARLRGCRIVMMNESHGGTEKATGWKRGIKQFIVRRFHSALVGGTPHIEYFSSLGLDRARIFPGYDAIDNTFFTTRSREARENDRKWREKLGLPNRYFLSLGRMVKKKNLTTLVAAYAEFRTRNPDSPQHLVFVGSGVEEASLRSLCQKLNLVDGEFAPSVHFLGFRQIQENPVFYALADAFILPSHTEEWGLVVNEAMACGLPVIVSRNLGCAPDLVIDKKNGFLFDPDAPSELANHLETLARDPNLRDAMGRESTAHISSWGLDNFAENAIRTAQTAMKP